MPDSDSAHHERITHAFVARARSRGSGISSSPPPPRPLRTARSFAACSISTTSTIRRLQPHFARRSRSTPGDVMSYWGEAVSYTHPVWNQQDTAAARAALRRLAATPAERLAKARTARERAWLATAEALYDARCEQGATRYALHRESRASAQAVSAGCRGAALLRVVAARAQSGRSRRADVSARVRDRAHRFSRRIRIIRVARTT